MCNPTDTESPQFLKGKSAIRKLLKTFHPLLIEGPGRSDNRDASEIAKTIIINLDQHFKEHNITKPILVITQGDTVDPGRNAGVASIARIVSEQFDATRLLVCLDEAMNPSHAKDADRRNVTYETRYSQMLEILKEHDGKLSDSLEDAIGRSCKEKDARRLRKLKRHISDGTQNYALLQEVTKAALKILSGAVTIAHTTNDLDEFSVTNFYTIGIDLGLIDGNDIVPYKSNS